MKVCIYGSASDKIDKIYKDTCYDLGLALAKRQHSMVFGAGGAGLMGVTARGFKAGGAYVHGFIPKFFEENGYEAIFYEADKITYTETMAERKAGMENECDAFIVVPGGLGTFEELFQIYTLKQLGRHKKAIVLFNINGYYDKMLEVIETSMEKGFINKECGDLIKVVDTIEEAISYIENYDTKDVDWNRLKNG